MTEYTELTEEVKTNIWNILTTSNADPTSVQMCLGILNNLTPCLKLGAFVGSALCVKMITENDLKDFKNIKRATNKLKQYKISTKSSREFLYTARSILSAEDISMILTYETDRLASNLKNII
jgi:hypothetical protein